MDSLSPLTLRRVIERSAELFADRPALSQVGCDPMTYREVYAEVVSLSAWLAEEGIGRGDRVAILSENCPNWGIVYFAVTAMGAIAVPILPDFHADAVHHIIRHSEAKAVFVSEKLHTKIEDGQFDPAPLFINMETFRPISQGTTRDMVREMKAKGRREFLRLKQKAFKLAHLSPTEPEEDDAAAIIYTSGTTGHSKGVVLTHRNIVWDAYTVRYLFQATPDDRMLSILPLSHTYECTLGLVLPIMNGTQVFYMDKPPTARALLPALAQVKPTAMCAVPLVIEKIFKTAILPKFTSSWLKRTLYAIPFVRKKMHAVAGIKLNATFGGCLRIFTIGGAALAPDVERFLREAGFPYAIGYGLTETSPMCAGTGAADTKLTSTGPAMPGVDIRIVNADPRTGEGEIEVRGPNVMREYYKAPQITAEVFTEDGWFRTGDLGKFDADGYLYIKGRLKNVIIGPSGENIYPEEVEATIHQSPYVLESLVYQLDGRIVARIHLDYARIDEECGNMTAQKMRDHISNLLEKIRNDVNEKVSTFARLTRVIEQTEPFEKTPTHKIKRYLYVG